MGKKLQSPKDSRWAGQSFEFVAREIWSADGSGEKIKSPEMEAVEEVLRQLSILPVRQDHVSSAAFNIASVMMWLELRDQPNCQENPKGTVGDLDEVHRLHHLLVETAHHMYQMHRGSRQAIENQDPGGWRKFQKEVARRSGMANSAWVELNRDEHRPYLRGRPKKDLADFRLIALQVYEYLTGRSAARKGPDYGPFVDYFRNLLCALGLDGSDAASQARTAIGERKAILEKERSEEQG
jgi:hypothetical protein